MRGTMRDKLVVSINIHCVDKANCLLHCLIIICVVWKEIDINRCEYCVLAGCALTELVFFCLYHLMKAPNIIRLVAVPLLPCIADSYLT